MQQFVYMIYDLKFNCLPMSKQRSQDEQLIHELLIRFDRKPRKCRKVNDSGIGSCERIVCVSDGRFQFYSKILDFNNLDFHKLQYANALAGIQLEQILELRFPSRRFNQRNHFTLIIPNNRILQFTSKENKENKKFRVVDEHAEGVREWTFMFDYDIISLPEYEMRLQKNKMLEMEKIQLQKQRDDQQLARKQQEINRKLQLEYESLVQTQKMEQEKLGLDTEEMIRRKQQIEKDKQKKNIEEADQLFFHQAYLKLLNCPENAEQQIIKCQEQVIEAIGKFKKRAQIVTKKYIDELPFNESPSIERKFQTKNLVLHISGDKHINLQYLDTVKVAQAIFKLRKQINPKIRVPLTAFIKYKGFKILVRAMTPCDMMTQKQKQQKFMHGNYMESWKTHFIIADDLNLLIDTLNLKPYNSELYFNRQQLHLGPKVQIMSTKQDPFSELKQVNNGQFSPLIRQSIMYVFNITEVHPIDLDLQKNIKQDTVRFRPQYVQDYVQYGQTKKTKLVGGAMTYEYQDQEGARDDLTLAKAAQNLKYVHLVKFVQNLDNLSFIPMTSQDLQSIMKQHGINMRYIAVMYKLTSLPYIREMLTIQAIAREIKKIYRDYQLDFVKEIFQYKYNAEIKDVYDKKSNNSLRHKRLKQLQMRQKDESASNAVDFLNMVFGNGVESEEFWQIIKKKVKDNYKITIIQHTDLSPGYLLTTVLYHCDFRLSLNSNFQLFSSPQPFTTKDWIDFKCRTNCITFPSMDSYTYSKVVPGLSKEQIIRRLETGIYLCRLMGNDETKLMTQLAIQTKKSSYRPKQKFTISNLKYQVINASKQNFENAYDICTFLLPSTHPFFQDLYLQYADFKTPECIIPKKAAKNHALRTLGLNHWKTSAILSQFKQTSYLQHLITAETGVEQNKKIGLYLKITKEQQKIGKFSDCFSYVKRTISFAEKKVGKLNEGELQHYFDVLMIGIKVTYRVRQIEDSLKIGEYYWNALQLYRKNVKSNKQIEQLLYYSLKGFLQNSKKQKLYLYKIILILEESIIKQKGQKKDVDIQNLRQRFRQSKTHINWIKQVLTKLQPASSEINFLSDFFTNFWKHIKKMHSEELEEGLDEMKILLKLFGRQYFEEALVTHFYTFTDTSWEENKRRNEKTEVQKQKDKK